MLFEVAVRIETFRSNNCPLLPLGNKGLPICLLSYAFSE